MARDWESQFRDWAKPPGKTEEDRCENAISAVRNAIEASEKLKNRKISILLQGSYQSNTNVRQNSDVDIGAVCTSLIFHTPLPEGLTRESLELRDSDYTFAQYKSEVEEALVKHFGRAAVRRGNKAFDVHETTYHVEADVVPFFKHRRYRADATFAEGVELRTSNGNARIINWPEQHYKNGCQKNTDTGTRFKSMVRVLKALSVEMTEAMVENANVSGFLIECLAWNVPNDHYQHSEYHADIRALLAFMFNKTMKSEDCSQWVEVSGMKWLFSSDQKWTWQQAHGFASSAWDYLELK